jgi:hypothetical protein
MTKIPVKTRIPIEGWTVALLVTLFSLISSAVQGPADDATTVFHAKLIQADPVVTSAIR